MTTVVQTVDFYSIFVDSWTKQPWRRPELRRFLEDWVTQNERLAMQYPGDYAYFEAVVDTLYQRLFHVGGVVVDVVNPFAVRRLAKSTQETLPARLDAKFQRRRLQRMRRLRPGAWGPGMQQQWYTEADTWAQLAQPPPQTTSSGVDDKRGKRIKLERRRELCRDSDTGRCALSGDKFDCVWDDAKDSFVFMDAMRLSDGRLVHVNAI